MALIKDVPTKNSTSHLLTDQCFHSIRQRLPVLNKTLMQYGATSAFHYIDDSLSVNGKPYQNHEDFIHVVTNYVAPLLGQTTAANMAARLTVNPSVLTANHHGVDYFAQSVQGSLLFGLSQSLSQSQCFKEPTKPLAVPVLACANIPLNNLTYPRGALLYPSIKHTSNAFPVKIPLFPDRIKRTVVSHTPAYNESMIARMRSTLRKKCSTTHNSNPFIFDTLDNILQNDYLQNDVLTLDNYSDQSVILNSRLWKKLFSPEVTPPPLVSLELERVVTRLLEYDLKNTESLAYLLLFEEKAIKRLHSNLNIMGDASTFLFWGIDPLGRRIPLAFESSRFELVGYSDQGSQFTIALTPSSILQALSDGRLLPSLFICFVVVAFARGIACAGGYYQAEYLPKMQQVVVSALKVAPEWQDIIDHVQSVNTTIYISGMQAVMSQLSPGELLPAGPIEMIASGGLTPNELASMKSITVEQAHMASVIDTVTDVMPDLIKTSEMVGWRQSLAKESYDLLKRSNIIVKSFSNNVK